MCANRVWKARFGADAEKDFAKLQPHDQTRVTHALDKLCLDPGACDFHRLRGRPEWRLRVGKLRVLIHTERDLGVFLVIRIDSRGDVYKGD